MMRRRHLCAFLGNAFGLALPVPSALAASELTIDRIRSENPAAARPRRRNYRVDAAVSIMGVTIYAQKGVGVAFASLSESADAGRRFASLQFAGMSIPEAAHGVHFGGSSEEAVEEC